MACVGRLKYLDSLYVALFKIIRPPLLFNALSDVRYNAIADESALG
jgi:hypothetical protein